MVYGQQADLYGLAMNGAFPHVYATACDSDKVIVWSAATRKVRCCAARRLERAGDTGTRAAGLHT